MIKTEALVCRFCGKDQPVKNQPVQEDRAAHWLEFDQTAFEKFKKDRIAANQAKNWFGREYLASIADEIWWKRDFERHLKEKA